MCPAPEEENETKEDGLGAEVEAEDIEGENIEGGKRISKRECPVPKPGGIVGEILGFKSSSGEKGSKPP
jgi:cytochrome c oxidase assembly factor 2